MKLIVSFKRKKISIDVKKTGFFRKGFGLMFRSRNTSNLLFEFKDFVTWKGNLTSYFVFFRFLTLWVDNENKVIDSRVIEPFIFSIKQKNRFCKIIEIPLNRKNKKLISKFLSKDDFFDYCRRGFFK